MNVISGISTDRVTVRMADMKICTSSRQEIVTYSLGSCLGIAVYDPLLRIGGMLHVLLPSSVIDPPKAQKTPFLFVDTGVPILFQRLYELGAGKQRLVVKVAGGATMQMNPTGSASCFNVGKRNFEALQHLFVRNSVSIYSMAVGGHISRTFRLEMATGNAYVETPGEKTVVL